MNSGLLFRDSATSKVLEFLERLAPTAIFTIDELRIIKDISYVAIRSVVTRLNQQGVIRRLSRGYYFIPSENEDSFPSIDRILETISRKENFRYCPIGEYAKYILGLRSVLPKEIECYTTGKLKTLNLENGRKIHFVPCKKKSFLSESNFHLSLVKEYIRETGINQITNEEIETLTVYLNSVGKEIEGLDYSSLDRFV